MDLLRKSSPNLLPNCLRFHFMSLERSLVQVSGLCPGPTVRPCPGSPSTPTLAALFSRMVPRLSRFFFLGWLPCFPNVTLPVASWEGVCDIKSSRLSLSAGLSRALWTGIYFPAERETPLRWVLGAGKSGANMMCDPWSFVWILFVFLCLKIPRLLSVPVSPWSWVYFPSVSGHSMHPFDLNHIPRS